jgi:CheY-like chemotaxis protein
MAHLALKTELSPKQKDYLQKIQTGAHSLLRIINDILDYSHIEAGQSKFDPMDFDLYSIIKDAVSTISQLAEEKGLVFSYEVDKNVPAYLTGDARRIGKILLILMNNAVKFTHEGLVSLHVSLMKEEDTRCTLSIEVKDTGIGIAADYQEQIFNPFSQVDYSSTRKYGGTGLGLALAKHFAQMMGGSIEVESTQAKGSTFCFTLPLEKQSSTALPKPKKTLNIMNIPHPQRIITQQSIAQTEVDGPRVLVVEDNVINQKMMLKLLGKLGHPAKVVENGRKAVDELQKTPYDLVLMDIQMPEMNGYEATYAIRNPQNNCINPQVPIIAVTANYMKADRKACLDAGMDDYLQKPLNPKMLLEKLRQWHPKKGSNSKRQKTTLSN